MHERESENILIVRIYDNTYDNSTKWYFLSILN